MFTGLVKEAARVLKNVPDAGSQGAHLVQVESCLAECFDLALGASVALNGVCLTVIHMEPATDSQSVVLSFDVSQETIKRTNLGDLKEASFVHMELPLAAGAPIGGHLVSGHVDGQCEVFSSEPVGDYLSLTLRLVGDSRKKIAPFLVEKGSVALDGVSLTVNSVVDRGDATDFEIMLIPHTLSLTWPDGLNPGRKINIEADLMAKHFVRFSTFQSANEKLPRQSVESNVENI
jgi:riboflavin synthase